MLKTTVTARRLQLHYHHEAPELRADHHICFPSTDGLLDHKQVPSAGKLKKKNLTNLAMQLGRRDVYF